MTLEPGFCLFAGGDSPEYIEEARAYIRRNGLTADDVKIVRRPEDDLVLVITKRALDWPVVNGDGRE